MTKFSPKLAFLSIAGSFVALLVGWLLDMAQAVSRKTPIYFINYLDAAVFSCFPDRVKLSILLLKEGAVGLVTKRCPKLGYASHLNRNVKNLKQKVGSHKNPSISDFITWPSGRPHHPGELSSSPK